LAAGAAGLYEFRRLDPYASAATAAQAARVDKGLQAELTPASFSGGNIVGGQGSEIGLAALVREAGGIVLSFSRGTARAAGVTGTTPVYTADVMLGLSAPTVATSMPIG
ncbi:hypothetical protein B4Q13_21185, partial [Lacticaseibacillus rhamnosus]